MKFVPRDNLKAFTGIIWLSKMERGQHPFHRRQTHHGKKVCSSKKVGEIGTGTFSLLKAT